MPFRPPIGLSNFRQLRDAGFSYVDKTSFVVDVLRSASQVLLFSRPRRFGKTLNLSTLRTFVERNQEDLTPLFEDLLVWQEGDIRAHFQKYPVIYLTFKDIKANSFELTLGAIKLAIQKLYDAHLYLLEAPEITRAERARFEAILDGREGEATWWGALEDLSTHLGRYHAQKVVILIDEYDTPLLSGYQHGFYDEMVQFLRNFFSGGLKDNPYLFKGILTGVLRVARGSLFSGLNNLDVYSLLSPQFSTRFGFTEAEVVAVVSEAGISERLETLRSWYNGYQFGGETVYNPWSILNFLNRADGVCRPYWVSTASNDLLRDLLIGQGPGVGPDMEILLAGGTLTKRLDENIALRDVAIHPDAVWSFLVFSGYLKVVETLNTDDTLHGVLAIPNREVRTTFADVFLGWLSEGLEGASRVDQLLKALLEGDTLVFEQLLGDLMVTTLSYHDYGRGASEKLYQAFILGLVVNLEGTYSVRSNRESGFGRYDVLICPRQPGRPGVVLELKVRDTLHKEPPRRALETALAQIKDRDYAAELREAGATPIHEMAAVFDGKRVWAKKLEREPHSSTGARLGSK